MKYDSSTNVHPAKDVPSLLSDFAALDKTAAKDNIASAIRIENSKYDELNSVTYNFTVKAEVLLETHEWANLEGIRHGRNGTCAALKKVGRECLKFVELKKQRRMKGEITHSAQSGITPVHF
ncbi:hypothetical protein ERJ75_001289500 [Trypanosoma vivax]|nr:hypothetical protein ERJ75_001289500 [Trypanosoma vivax]